MKWQMETFLQLSPVAQAVLLHFRDTNARAGDDIPVTSIVSAISLRKGFRIRETVNGIDECVSAQWVRKVRGPSGQPDRIALTTEGFGMLLFMP